MDLWRWICGIERGAGRQSLWLFVNLPVQWPLPPRRGTTACPSIVAHITKRGSHSRCGRSSCSMHPSTWKDHSANIACYMLSDVPPSYLSQGCRHRGLDVSRIFSLLKIHLVCFIIHSKFIPNSS